MKSVTVHNRDDDPITIAIVPSESMGKSDYFRLYLDLKSAEFDEDEAIELRDFLSEHLPAEEVPGTKSQVEQLQAEIDRLRAELDTRRVPADLPSAEELARERQKYLCENGRYTPWEYFATDQRVLLIDSMGHLLDHLRPWLRDRQAVDPEAWREPIRVGTCLDLSVPISEDNRANVWIGTAYGALFPADAARAAVWLASFAEAHGVDIGLCGRDKQEATA